MKAAKAGCPVAFQVSRAPAEPGTAMHSFVGSLFLNLRQTCLDDCCQTTDRPACFCARLLRYATGCIALHVAGFVP